MREFAKIPSNFWINSIGQKIRDADSDTKITALYLLTNPHAHMLGIYYLPVSFIALETGIPMEGATKGLQNLIEMKFCSYDRCLQYVWIHDMAFDQIGTQFKANDNRVKALNRMYAALPNLPFLADFYKKYATAFLLEERSQGVDFLHHLDQAPLDTLRSKEKEKEKDKKKEKKKEKIFMSSQPDPIFVEKNQLSSANKQSMMFKSQAMEVLQFLNEKTGRVYRPVETNLKLIIARLKSSATVMDCRQVIAKKTREWKGNPIMAEYLRPATLFNATKFEQYMGELVLPKEE